MFSYQWRINQTDIDSATSSSYVIPSVNESEHGTYECVVTNHWNEMEVSAPVQLIVTSMSTTMDVWMNAVYTYIWQSSALGLLSTHEFDLVTLRSQKSCLNIINQLCLALPLQHAYILYVCICNALITVHCL